MKAQWRAAAAATLRRVSARSPAPRRPFPRPWKGPDPSWKSWTPAAPEGPPRPRASSTHGPDPRDAGLSTRLDVSPGTSPTYTGPHLARGGEGDPKGGGLGPKRAPTSKNPQMTFPLIPHLFSTLHGLYKPRAHTTKDLTESWFSRVVAFPMAPTPYPTSSHTKNNPLRQRHIHRCRKGKIPVPKWESCKDIDIFSRQSCPPMT